MIRCSGVGQRLEGGAGQYKRPLSLCSALQHVHWDGRTDGMHEVRSCLDLQVARPVVNKEHLDATFRRVQEQVRQFEPLTVAADALSVLPNQLCAT